MSIRNTSTTEQRFRLADHRQFTVAIEARTPENTIVPHSRSFLDVQSMNQPVFFREISLEPGEEYSFIERLDRHVEIDTPGVYVLQAVFTPMLSSRGGDQATRMRSNRLTLTLRPPTAQLEAAIVAAEQEVRSQLLRQDLSPDRTVEHLVESRQRQQWERFFLYLDVESIMLRNPRLERQFRNSSPQQRTEMIERYMELMRQQETEDEILQIPQSFRMLQTEYTPTDGSVVVEKRFAFPTYTEIKEYTYYLRRLDSHWVVYDYSVRNLGTE